MVSVLWGSLRLGVAEVVLAGTEPSGAGVMASEATMAAGGKCSSGRRIYISQAVLETVICCLT
jgi:hypothetical protein